MYATSTAVLVHSLATILQVGDRGKGRGCRRRRRSWEMRNGRRSWEGVGESRLGSGGWAGRDGGKGLDGECVDAVMLHVLLCWCTPWRPCYSWGKRGREGGKQGVQVEGVGCWGQGGGEGRCVTYIYCCAGAFIGNHATGGVKRRSAGDGVGNEEERWGKGGWGKGMTSPAAVLLH